MLSLANNKRRAVSKTKQKPPWRLDKSAWLGEATRSPWPSRSTIVKGRLFLFCLGNGDESKQYSFYIVSNTRPVKGQHVSFFCTCVSIVGSSHSKLLSMAHKSHIFALIFGFFSVTSALNYSALSTPPSPTRLIFRVSLQLGLGITSSRKPSLIFLNWVRVSPVYSCT